MVELRKLNKATCVLITPWKAKDQMNQWEFQNSWKNVCNLRCLRYSRDFHASCLNADL